MDQPCHRFQQLYQAQNQNHQKPNSLRNLYSNVGQASQAGAYRSSSGLQDQSQHHLYVPPFHVVGFAPGPVTASDGGDGGADVQWNYGFEPRMKRLKERDFLENNSQISSIDFIHPRSVSTGLGLSLDNNRMAASSNDSALLSLIGDGIDLELQRQDAEIDRFLKIQGDRLRQTILEKVQASQLQTISLLQDKVLHTLREKEAELENINKRNKDLEVQIDQLSMEAEAWQQRARYNENTITTLERNLQQVHSRGRDIEEGFGDSEVEDTASCCSGRAVDFHLLCKAKNEMNESMTCKVCRVKEVCMVLLPCKHLCLCKDCESKVSFCPQCEASKFLGMEVYM